MSLLTTISELCMPIKVIYSTSHIYQPKRVKSEVTTRHSVIEIKLTFLSALSIRSLGAKANSPS